MYTTRICNKIIIKQSFIKLNQVEIIFILLLVDAMWCNVLGQFSLQLRLDSVGLLFNRQ
jgi:hypothetical protein